MFSEEFLRRDPPEQHSAKTATEVRLEQQAAEAKAYGQAVLRDAARYRWLRQLKGAQEAVGESSPEGVDLLVDEEIRAEQDAGD